MIHFTNYEKFGYKWDPKPGYDSFSKEEKRVQIKTRKVWVDGDRSKTFNTEELVDLAERENMNLTRVFWSCSVMIVELWKPGRHA